MLLLREDPAIASASPTRRPPREGRGWLLFVAASVIGHAALVAAAPTMPTLATMFVQEDLVFMDLEPEPAPETEALPTPIEEPDPDEPEPIEEPTEKPPVEEPTEQPPVEPPTEQPPVEEPTEQPPVEEPTEEPPVEEPAVEASVAANAHDGAEAAETVASTEGGVAVDRAAGAGREGAARGATRTEPAPVRPDPNALRTWRVSAMRALGRPQPTLALRRTGQEGIAWVAFQVDANGKVIGVRLYQSSGHELVDEAALTFARTRRALPRPPAPWAVRWVRLPIRYRAERG